MNIEMRAILEQGDAPFCSKNDLFTRQSHHSENNLPVPIHENNVLLFSFCFFAF